MLLVERTPAGWLPSMYGAVGVSVGLFVARTALAERQRHTAALLLARSEERYRLLFERNLAGVYRSTTDGRILDCNAAFARIFGFASKEEALASSAVALYGAPEEREGFVEELRRAGQLRNHERRFTTKQGRPIWTLENAHLAGDVV
jgi:PAS domain S-box-containing protein